MSGPPPRVSSSRLAVLVLLFAFAVVFVAIIVIADRGEGRRYWPFLESIPAGDKLGHLGLLGVFSFLLNLALRGRRAPGWLSWMMWGSLALFVAMTLEELSQLFLATRTFDALDWLANLAGIAVGEWCVRVVRKRRQPMSRVMK